MLHSNRNEEIQLHASTWINLTNMMLHKKSKAQNTYSMIPLI